MKPQFSLIVPVFNGEAFLRRCLQSVVVAAQGHSVELILIDDGSTDGSAAIAYEFLDKYSWIRYIRQFNQGPSYARNAGLGIASGNYIGFVDCDDCVMPTYFSALSDEIVTLPDIVVFGYERKLINGKLIIHSPVRSNHLDDATRLLCKVNMDRELFWFSCTKLFRMDLIRDVRFDGLIKLGEDTIFNIEAVSRAHRISRIPNVIYSYYETPGSLTSRMYKPLLLESMERHFYARLVVHHRFGTEMEHEVRKDMSNYYLGHIVPWLVSNAIEMERGAQLDELARIRNSRIVEMCFAWGERIKAPRGVIALLVLLKFRMLRLLRAIWSWKSGARC